MKKIPLILFILANITTAHVDYQDDLADSFNLTSEITPTLEGIKEYLEKIYNNDAYAKTVLPTNFSHLRQLIGFGAQTKQGPDYLKHILRIFRQKFMACEYTCAQETAYTINYLCTILQKFKIEKKDNIHCVSNIKNICYEEFSTKFEDFKNDPDVFLTKLSEKIHESMSYETGERETKPSEVRTLVVRFLDTIISKILWSPEEGKRAWQEFVTVGDALNSLSENKIICKEEDLNDLTKLLTERFIYFLSIAGAELDESFFEAARNDLLNKKLPWLETEELEHEITKRLDLIRKALIQAQIKSKAKRDYGILS